MATDEIKGFTPQGKGVYTLTKTKDGKTATITVIDTDGDGLDKNDSVKFSGDVSIFNTDLNVIKDRISKGIDNKKYDANDNDPKGRTEEQSKNLKFDNLTDDKGKITTNKNDTYSLGSLMEYLNKPQSTSTPTPTPTPTQVPTPTPTSAPPLNLTSEVIGAQAAMSVFATLCGLGTAPLGAVVGTAAFYCKSIDTKMENFTKALLTPTPTPTSTPTPTETETQGTNITFTSSDELPPTPTESVKINQTKGSFKITVDLRKEKDVEGDTDEVKKLKKQVKDAIDAYIKASATKDPKKIENAAAAVARYKYKLDKLGAKRDYEDYDQSIKEKTATIEENLGVFTGLPGTKNEPNENKIKLPSEIKIGKKVIKTVGELKQLINKNIAEYKSTSTSDERRFQLGCSIVQLKNLYDKVTGKKQDAVSGNETKNQSSEDSLAIKKLQNEINAFETSDRFKSLETKINDYKNNKIKHNAENKKAYIAKINEMIALLNDKLGDLVHRENYQILKHPFKVTELIGELRKQEQKLRDKIAQLQTDLKAVK